MRLFNLVSLLVSSKVREVEPSAFSRAMRLMPKSKPGSAAPTEAGDAPHTEAKTAEDNR